MSCRIGKEKVKCAYYRFCVLVDHGQVNFVTMLLFELMSDMIIFIQNHSCNYNEDLTIFSIPLRYWYLKFLYSYIHEKHH